MRVFFATSSLSHLPLTQASHELASLGREGVRCGLISGWGLQLCGGHRGHGPWNADDVREQVLALVGEDGELRTHHAFTFRATTRRVWEADGSLSPAPDASPYPLSVHPPRSPTPAVWVEEARHAVAGGRLDAVEVMYRGYADVPLDGTLPLAVDISHVNLWPDRCPAFLDHLSRQLVREVHVSHNGGRGDDHLPLCRETFGLSWAAGLGRDGAILVLECMMRRMSFAERLKQLEVLADA